MNESDYPALFRAADAASLRAQKAYLRIIRWQSIFLIAGTALGAEAVRSRGVALLSAAIFLAGIALSVLLVVRNYEAVWYRTRAVAESVKTSTWRFMMRAEPFDSGLSQEAAETGFRTLLRKILGEHAHLSEHFGADAATAESITPSMLQARAEALEERKAFYRRYRIDEQRAWYAKKSAANHRAGRWWLAGLMVCQVLAIALVLVRIAYPQLEDWAVQTLAVAAASILTWMQLKRFRELGAAYGLTAHEIGILQGDIEQARDEQRFSSFVGDTENAFSREHTQWVARKDLQA
jgi:hypothetical protein